MNIRQNLSVLSLTLNSFSISFCQNIRQKDNIIFKDIHLQKVSLLRHFWRQLSMLAPKVFVIVLMDGDVLVYYVGISSKNRLSASLQK
jgi:hypothetical protein